MGPRRTLWESPAQSCSSLAGYDGIEVMGDLWELDLRGLAANYTKKEETAKYSGNCVWRMRAGSTEDNKWLHSCGSDGEGRGQAERCAINDILLRAFWLFALVSV